MPSDPKLVVRDVFVADARHPLRILVHNRGQLFHLEPLRIVFANLMNVRNDTIEIDRIRVDDEIFRYHDGTPWRTGKGLKLGEGLKHSRNQKRWAGPRKGSKPHFREIFQPDEA